MVKVCVYDNPATMARECWQNGKLQVAYSVAVLESKSSWPPPPKYFHLGANCGPWHKGRLIGDLDAMCPNA